MNPRKAKDIQSALLKKGFREDNRDHHFYFLWVGNKKSSVRTKISHGIEEYGIELLKRVSEQLHLTNKELNDLLDCPLTLEGYVRLLRQRKIVS